MIFTLVIFPEYCIKILLNIKVLDQSCRVFCYFASAYKNSSIKIPQTETNLINLLCLVNDIIAFLKQLGKKNIIFNCTVIRPC